MEGKPGKDDLPFEADREGTLYDVAVVGAGPAGSLAAAAAARAGLSVLLLEKRKLPREKVCGGLISSRALSLLPPGLLEQVTGSAITAVRVHSGGKSHLYRSGETLGLVVRRAEFDLLLAQYARACGTVLVEDSPLTRLAVENPGPASRESRYQLTSGGAAPAAYRARCVVGADGARGVSAVLSGLRRQSLLKPAGWGYETMIPAPPAWAEPGTAQFYILPFQGGMGWSFPGDGWVNRGVGAPAGPARLKGHYRRLFPETLKTARPASWPLPFTGPLKSPVRGNLLLVGDAAGVVDPFSGEGVHNAFQSALLAVSALKAAFAENRAAGPLYSRLFRDHFGGGFLPAMTGAALLHAGCVLKPGGLPRAIAAIMRNRYWFNRDLPERLKEQESGVRINCHAP